MRNFYMAPKAASSTATGDSPSNPVELGIEVFDQYVQPTLTYEDVTVYLLPGTYSQHIDFREYGHPKHQLTIQGDRIGGGSVFDDEIDLTDCENIVLGGMDFTTEKGILTALGIGKSRHIRVENCNFYRMPQLGGSKGGGAARALYGSRDIVFSKCVFFECGIDEYAHFMYHAGEVEQIVIEECHFHRCPGEYVKFRGTAKDCVVRSCTFIYDKSTPQDMILFAGDGSPGNPYGRFGSGLLVENNRFIQASPIKMVSYWDYEPSRPPYFDKLNDPAIPDAEVIKLVRDNTNLDLEQVTERDNRVTFDPAEFGFGFVMDIHEGSNRAGRNLWPLIKHGENDLNLRPVRIRLADFESAAFPRWKIIDLLNDGKCLIENQDPEGRMLDILGNDAPQPFVTGLRYVANAPLQKWRLVPMPTMGEYCIVNIGRESHGLGAALDFDVVGAVSPNAILAPWDQENPFQRWRVEQLPNGFALIVNVSTNKVLTG